AMADQDRIRTVLEGIVGPENLLASGEADSYRVDGQSPRFVLFPDAAEQISEIVRLASEENFAILPRGGGTKMHVGNKPKRADLIVSLSRLNQVLEHEPSDLTVTAEAGVILNDLQRLLQEHNQSLPLDPPFSSSATLGGIIATNSSGPKRLAYGTARDLVIGIRVVNADGKITKAGGKVVKNVTGYDLNKLYVGSFGTLGIFVTFTFKLRPLPQEARTFLALFPSWSSALELAQKILKVRLIPTALEIVNPSALESLSDLSGMKFQKNLFGVIVRFEEVKAAVEREISQTASLCQQLSPSASLLVEGKEQESLWEAIRTLPYSFQKDDERAAVCKTSLLPSKVGELFRLEEDFKKGKTTLSTVAHYGNGIVYTTMIPENRHELPPLLSHWREEIEKLGGATVIEVISPLLKGEVNVWGNPRSDFPMMKRIKEALDPKGILNPGRFVGGI
ncbi:MAG: FAD-binding oxidoreductase, partial [Candidatus Tectomicrobia bacterium]|nr:FAD-binding oxidoreductase [Candidatus Tectomicrobia bacterium]